MKNSIINPVQKLRFKEAGIEFSSETTEREALKVAKKDATFSNQLVAEFKIAR